MLKKSTNLLLIFLFNIIIIFANESDNKINVITTLFPTYDFVKQIAKDKVNLTFLLPPGVEPHSFEPKAKDIVLINKSDIFIFTGKNMEPWAISLLKGVDNNKLLVVDASKGVEFISGFEHENHNDCKHAKDPHIWLDFNNAKIMVNTILNALKEKDSRNSDFYEKNATDYKIKLNLLDNSFKNTLLLAKHKTIIYAGHFAFGYLARRYHLKHISPYKNFSPNSEPSPKGIGELIKTLKKSGQKYIYFEELLDPKVARIISEETNVLLLMLHGAHNVSKEELLNGVTFLEIMESNLEKLKIGLECN